LAYPPFTKMSEHDLAEFVLDFPSSLSLGIGNSTFSCNGYAI